jgi:CO/xanthine dehydrogenase FAD-binding subunit
MPDIATYAAPRSLNEAFALLGSGEVTILAGGTDLMVQTRAGKSSFKPTLMNIRRIPELSGITDAGSVVRIGALATVTDLRDSDLIRQRFGALWQACDHFASDQIRNAATIGGNICNASPAGDMLVPLLVLDARVVLAGKPNGSVGRRTLPLAEFLVGPGRTAREPTELLEAVEIPAPAAGFFSSFFKFGVRPALDISVISIGLGAVRDGRRLTGVRVAFGAVAPTVIRVPATEALLEGRTLDTATIAAAAAEAVGEIHPIGDLRASAWYRRELVGNMLRRMLEHVSNG